jgi:hypothetical protein
MARISSGIADEIDGNGVSITDFAARAPKSAGAAQINHSGGKHVPFR